MNETEPLNIGLPISTSNFNYQSQAAVESPVEVSDMFHRVLQ